MAVGDHMATEDQFREAEPFLGVLVGPRRAGAAAGARELAGVKPGQRAKQEPATDAA